MWVGREIFRKSLDLSGPCHCFRRKTLLQPQFPVVELLQDSERMLEDPDDLVDVLPQPYRMLDKLVAQVVEGAIEVGLEKEKADKIHSLTELKSSRSVPIGKECTSFALTSDSKQVAVGSSNGTLSLLNLDDGSVNLSKDLELGEIQAVSCYKSQVGEELFCIYAYGSLNLYKVIEVEKEVELEVKEDENAQEDEGSEDKPTTVTKTFPEFDKVHQIQVREPSSDATRFELTMSPNRRFLSLFMVDDEPEIKFYEIRTEKVDVAEEEGEQGQGDKEGNENENESGGGGAEDAVERPASYTHELVDVGTFNNSSAESFFDQSLSDICYSWVLNVEGEEVGILLWDKGGNTLVFTQLCKEYSGSISTVEGKNSTWTMPFAITCVAFDAKSDLLLIGSKKGFVSMWNMFYIDHFSFLKENTYPTALKLKRDEKTGHMLVACTASDCSFCIYDTELRKVLRRIILPFVASSFFLEAPNSMKYWWLHGFVGGDETTQLVSVLDLDECKPVGSDIVFGSTNKSNVAFSLGSDMCCIMTKDADEKEEEEAPESPLEGSAGEGEQQEEEKTPSFSLNLYDLNFSVEKKAEQLERSDLSDALGEGGFDPIFLEKSLVFKCLFDHISQLDDDFERKKSEIRKNLVNLSLKLV